MWFDSALIGGNQITFSVLLSTHCAWSLCLWSCSYRVNVILQELSPFFFFFSACIANRVRSVSSRAGRGSRCIRSERQPSTWPASHVASANDLCAQVSSSPWRETTSRSAWPMLVTRLPIQWHKPNKVLRENFSKWWNFTPCDSLGSCWAMLIF